MTLRHAAATWQFWCIVLLGLSHIGTRCDARAVNVSNTWTMPQEGLNVFYRFFRDRISWFEADAVCQFHHANLVTVDNSFQFDATRDLLRELDVNDIVWIGLMRPQNSERFMWSNSRPLVTDTGYWAESLPLMDAPLCAVIDPIRDYRWHALRCGGPETASFLCEMPVPSWADACILKDMPNLTMQYMADTASIELIRNCAEEGLLRQSCKGKQDRERAIRELICPRERLEAQRINDITNSHFKSLQIINSIRTDNNENNDIELLPLGIDAYGASSSDLSEQVQMPTEKNTVQRLIEQFNVDELMQADEPQQQQPLIPMKRYHIPGEIPMPVKKAAKKVIVAGEYQKKERAQKPVERKRVNEWPMLPTPKSKKQQLLTLEDLMMGDQPRSGEVEMELERGQDDDVSNEIMAPLPHKKKILPQDLQTMPPIKEQTTESAEKKLKEKEREKERQNEKEKEKEKVKEKELEKERGKEREKEIEKEREKQQEKAKQDEQLKRAAAKTTTTTATAPTTTTAPITTTARATTTASTTTAAPTTDSPSTITTSELPISATSTAMPRTTTAAPTSTAGIASASTDMSTTTAATLVDMSTTTAPIFIPEQHQHTAHTTTNDDGALSAGSTSSSEPAVPAAGAADAANAHADLSTASVSATQPPATIGHPMHPQQPRSNIITEETQHPHIKESADNSHFIPPMLLVKSHYVPPLKHSEHPGGTAGEHHVMHQPTNTIIVADTDAAAAAATTSAAKQDLVATTAAAERHVTTVKLATAAPVELSTSTTTSAATTMTAIKSDTTPAVTTTTATTTTTTTAATQTMATTTEAVRTMDAAKPAAETHAKLIDSAAPLDNQPTPAATKQPTQELDAELIPELEPDPKLKLSAASTSQPENARKQEDDAAEDTTIAATTTTTTITTTKTTPATATETTEAAATTMDANNAASITTAAATMKTVDVADEIEQPTRMAKEIEKVTDEQTQLAEETETVTTAKMHELSTPAAATAAATAAKTTTSTAQQNTEPATTALNTRTPNAYVVTQAAAAATTITKTTTTTAKANIASTASSGATTTAATTSATATMPTITTTCSSAADVNESGSGEVDATGADTEKLTRVHRACTPRIPRKHHHQQHLQPDAEPTPTHNFLNEETETPPFKPNRHRTLTQPETVSYFKKILG